jgi:cytochrome c peroxidase
MSKVANVLRSGAGIALVLAGCAVAGEGESEEQEGNLEPGLEVNRNPLEAAWNSAGVAESVHASGSIDRANPFFQAVGTNLRTCETCHSAAQGWTITAFSSALLFHGTDGLAPLFMLHDSGSRPDADISTLDARRATWKDTLLARGLTRFSRTLSNPAAAEFTITAVVDPYGFSTTTLWSGFRRPTPTSNESKVASTGWNGVPSPDVAGTVFNTAIGASRLHLQRADALPADLAAAMRDFQLGLVFAQSFDYSVGRLDAAGARGGPVHLLAQPFHVGINDLQGLDPQAPGRPFDRKVFDIFDAWAPSGGGSWARDSWSIASWSLAGRRAAIYRGQERVNHREFEVSGVTGLNDVLGQEIVRGTCSTCHNAPNVGGHSVFRLFDMGTADEERCSPALPLLTLVHKTTGVERKVCDLARATSTGKWADVGAFRAPPLRGLAARAPYFHDGQLATIRDVVDYYDERFGMGLTYSERRDLIAFLRAL